MSIDLQQTLVGAKVSLRPLEARDFEALHSVASDPEIWATHPDSTRYRPEVFQNNFFAGAIASGTAYAVILNKTRAIVGSTRFYDVDLAHRELAIGYTFYERALWGTGVNDEVKALMLNHVFDRDIDTVWLHVAKMNLRSRRATEKLGAVLSHEDTRLLNGEEFAQLYYRLDKSAYQDRESSIELL